MNEDNRDFVSRYTRRTLANKAIHDIHGLLDDMHTSRQKDVREFRVFTALVLLALLAITINYTWQHKHTRIDGQTAPAAGTCDRMPANTVDKHLVAD